jgi:RNA polymerase sigma factor (sigma-70 family)
MDDLELIQSCSNGDKHSLEEFLSRYSRLIYNYIISVFRNKNCKTSYDLVSDIFNEFFCFLFKDGCRKLKSFKAKNNSTLATWLRVVTIHFTIDYLRSQKESISLEEEDSRGLTLQEKISSDALSAPDFVYNQEVLNSLSECTELLDPDERLFIELHVHQGVKLSLLKEYFNISRGSIDMQKSRIIAKLRDCFRKKGIMLDL